MINNTLIIFGKTCLLRKPGSGWNDLREFGFFPSKTFFNSSAD